MVLNKQKLELMNRINSAFKQLFLLGFFVLSAASVYAQFPVLDQEPATKKWYQANTPHFRLIYQEGNDSLALGLATKLQSLYTPVSASLGASPRKISVVLRSQTTIPNGFVRLAPRKSEFFSMPPQGYNFLGTNRWLDLLATHEFRHIVQFQKSRTGFNKFFHFVAGEEGLAGMSFMAVPQWFWEGDAVAIETVHTPSGRGKIPEFSMAFRANMLERGPFSYNKQYLRSFKDFVPNHYVTGYYMVTHLRRQYAESPWDDIVERAFSKPFIPFTFSRAIKKETGRNVVKTYRQMVGELDSLWRDQLYSLDTTAAFSLTSASPKAYTNYMFPQAMEDGSVLAFKSGIGDITQLVRIGGDGKERTEFVPGFVADAEMLSARKGLVVWTEYRPDLRWGARTSNELKVYNTKSGKIRSLTGSSRYSSAALSPDTSRLASIYVSEKNEYALAVLDIESGKEIMRFPNKENHFISMPRWSDDGKYILAILTGEQGKTIIQADVEAGTVEELLPWANENYGHPVKAGGYLLYNWAYSGIDNIYALDLGSGRRYQLTSRKHGAFNPSLSPDGKTLFFNDYQVYGMQVAKMPFLPASWKPLEEVENRWLRYYEPLIAQEEKAHTALSADTVTNEVVLSRYSSVNHLLNIHSWGFLMAENYQTPAIGIKSNNILNTAAFTAGYGYNIAEQAGYGFGRFSYQGLFPILDLDVRLGNRSVRESFQSGDSTVSESLSWQERHTGLGVRLPFNFTRSKYVQTLMLEGNAGLTEVRNYNSPFRKSERQADGQLRAVKYGFRYNRFLKRSKRDIHSRWGQSIQATFRHTPLGGDYTGRLAFVQAQLFYPGLFKHHSFYVRGGYQYQDMEAVYRFRSGLLYPRGYVYTAYEDLFVTSFNYTLPLLYPDWSLGPFLYFQRFRANVFHDRGWGSGIETSGAQLFESSGLELSADFNVMRFLPLLNLGVRYVYNHEQDRHIVQLMTGALAF